MAGSGAGDGGVSVDLEWLIREIEAFKVPHAIVEDCWYSCAKAVYEDGESACCNDDSKKIGLCDCGADAHNAAVDALIERLSESA
jgi:hypothetical protein